MLGSAVIYSHRIRNSTPLADSKMFNDALYIMSLMIALLIRLLIRTYNFTTIMIVLQVVSILAIGR